MTTVLEAIDPRRVIADAAGPWSRDEKRPSWLSRAAHEIGLPVGVISALWYGKRKRLIDRELILLSKSAATIKERRQRMVILHDQIRAARSCVPVDVAGREDLRACGADRADVTD